MYFTFVFQWQLIRSSWKAANRSTSSPVSIQAPATLWPFTPPKAPSPAALWSPTSKHVSVHFSPHPSVWQTHSSVWAVLQPHCRCSSRHLISFRSIKKSGFRVLHHIVLDQKFTVHIAGILKWDKCKYCTEMEVLYHTRKARITIICI